MITTKNCLPKKKIVVSPLVLLLAFSVTVAPFSASETFDFRGDVEVIKDDSINYYYEDWLTGRERCGQLYWANYEDKLPEEYSEFDVYGLEIYTLFTPGDALDNNGQYLHDAYVKLDLQSNQQHIDEYEPKTSIGTFTWGISIDEISIDVTADHNDGGYVIWDIDINNWAGRLKHDLVFTFTALVMTDPGAPADGLIEIWTKWSGNEFYDAVVREERTEQISYYYDFGGDDGEDGEIGPDPTDPDSTPSGWLK